MMRAGPPLPGRIHRYVALLALLAIALTALVALVGEPSRPDPLVALGLVVGIAVAERTQVAFRWGRTSGQFTLIEVAVTAGLLLVPPVEVAVAAVAAMALAHARLWRTPVKIVYNAATAALGTAIAGLVLSVLPAVGPRVAGRPVLTVVLGMTGYGAIAALSFSGLLSRLQDRTGVTLRDQLPLHVASTLGTISSGVVLAALLDLAPTLAPFVLAPVAAVYVALRGSVRASELLAAQRVEHDRLVRVVDGASDGIVLLDGDGCIQVWNPAMSRLTGRADTEVVGRHVDEVLTPEVRQPAGVDAAPWLPDAAGRLPRREVDARLADREGVVRDVRESHAFTFDDRGRCTGAVMVVRDVSRQRELERLRSDFVARVSHELRSPLTPIRGFATVLLRRGDRLDRAQREEALARIVDRSEHLHQLVENLLLVTRLERAETSGLAAAGPTDLGEIARGAADELRALHLDRTILVTAAEDTPLALADPERVRQILAALLDNAVRYSPDDTPVHIEVDRADDGGVRVRVVDYGSGIPAHQREAVFERFHRLEDPLTMRTSGVGVGLFIARQLAEVMQGRLELEASSPGQGCTFVLWLPSTIATVRHHLSG